MDPERWRHVETLYHATLARPAGERSAFLAEACAADEWLRREVQSLLDQPGSGHGAFEGGALAIAAKGFPASASGGSLIGRRIGPYEVTVRLGAGGMGEVFRAHDTTLGRDVAIKILPGIFTSDPDRLARFEREARVLASLNHPHIGAIYGVEDAEGVRALVLELVDGETLAERIKRATTSKGPGLPVTEALAIARQITDALDAAHEKGIIHRDLKPANIKITPDGLVKVLDFGLAKAASGDTAPTDLTQSPTITVGGTQEGVILGTAPYMSPEQARGQAVDKRTDIWAFGCVLYEMLTGRSPFARGTMTDTLAAVVEREPDWTALPSDLPASVTRLLRRCLEKDPRRRLRDIGDTQSELEGTATAPDPGVTNSVPLRTRARRLAAAVGAAATVAALTALWMGALTRDAPAALQPTARLTLTAPAGQPLWLSEADRDFVISRDGTRIVYVSGHDGALMVRAIDRLDAVRLGNITGARHPFVSPDGQWVGFFVGVSSTELKKVSITGGPAISLCRVPGGARGATWGTDDAIIFATSPGRLLRVPASGGEPTVLSTPDTERGETGHIYPSLLPGGQAVLMTVTTTGNPLDNGQIVALDFKTGQRKTLLNGGSQPEYVETGHLVYGAAGALRAVRFDASTLEVTGEPLTISNNVTTIASSGAVGYSLSRSGALVYRPGGVIGAARSLVWVDRQGREEPIDAPPRMYSYSRLSPDGSRAALDIRDQEQDIWVWNFARRTLTRVTRDPAQDRMPVWTTDGRRVVFASRRDGTGGLFWQAADGTGIAQRLSSTDIQIATSVSPDGTRLVVSEGGRIRVLSIERVSGTDRPPLQVEPIPNTAFKAGPRTALSPDGRWLAYESIEVEPQIQVRPFPNVDDGSTQISANGGTQPVWSRSGQELFYLDLTGAMIAVPVQMSPSFTIGSPTRLFDGRYTAGGSGPSYDVAPDGRFLMIKDAAVDQVSTNLVVVWNWVDELNRLLPSR